MRKKVVLIASLIGVCTSLIILAVIPLSTYSGNLVFTGIAGNGLTGIVDYCYDLYDVNNNCVAHLSYSCIRAPAIGETVYHTNAYGWVLNIDSKLDMRFY